MTQGKHGQDLPARLVTGNTADPWLTWLTPGNRARKHKTWHERQVAVNELRKEKPQTLNVSALLRRSQKL